MDMVTFRETLEACRRVDADQVILDTNSRMMAVNGGMGGKKSASGVESFLKPFREARRGQPGGKKSPIPAGAREVEFDGDSLMMSMAAHHPGMF